jgi:RNA polymerase sigma-70 factor, ECF subfamily
VLYRRHGDTVFRYAWHLLGRREDAEDATQATFLAVHKALAGGAAVLDSSAWVVRIARNECMGRLRQTARRPAVSLDDGFDPPAVGGVERSAELRDEVRTARKTLNGLPEPEREAFVLREWLGLEAGEAALALGLTAGDVDGLASRARRSLVLAVGGLEPAVGCSGTRSALEAGSLDRAAKVHLLRCPVCRGVRRALRPPEAAARPVVAQRLSAIIPGFASGGGILAALMAKAAAAPVLAKTTAIVVAAVAAGGAAEQAIVSVERAHHGRAHGGPAQLASALAVQRGGNALAASVAQPPRATPAAASLVELTSRGAAAKPTGRDGTSGIGDDRGGHASGDDERGGHDSSSGTTGGESGDHERSARVGGGSESGKHSSGDDGASSRTGKATDSGSGTAGGARGDSVDQGTSGKDGATAGATVSGDSGSSGSGKDSADTSGGDHVESHGGDAGALPLDEVVTTSSESSGSD